VRPLDAMPMTTSFLPGLRRAISSRPCLESSSLTSESEAKALRPRDDELDAIDVKRGRTLRRIKSGNAAAGAGSHVDESPPRFRAAAAKSIARAI